MFPAASQSIGGLCFHLFVHVQHYLFGVGMIKTNNLISSKGIYPGNQYYGHDKEKDKILSPGNLSQGIQHSNLVVACVSEALLELSHFQEYLYSE